MSILKKLYILSLTASLLIGAGGCSDDLDFNNGGVVEPGTLILSTQPTLTRANTNFETDGHAEDNEENIGRVTLFFFSSYGSTDKAFYVYETSVNKVTAADLTVKIPNDYLPYFTEGTSEGTRSAYVYAFVNAPAEVEVDKDKAKVTYIDGGKQTTVDATLYNLSRVWVSEPGFVNQILPADFFMRGKADVTARQINGRWQAEGFIPLERLASKVRLFAKLPEKVYIAADGSTIERGVDESEESWEERKAGAAEVWEPAPGGDGGEMKLYFYNSATRGRADGNVNGYNRTAQAFGNVNRDKELEDVVRRLSSDAELLPSDEDEEYTFSHSVPYYSYPNIWDSSLASEEYMTYVVVELPWHKIENSGSGSGTYQTCYYQVPVNAVRGSSREADCLEPNTYYRIKIRLGTLGSKNFGDPLEVEGSYEALDWVKTDIDVNIKGKRYLIVNQTEWTMNNLHTLEIPFSTSHKTIVEECYVTYFRYNDIWGTEPKTDPEKPNFYHNKKEFSTWLTLATQQLGGRDRDGIVAMDSKTSVDGKVGDTLYYKKEYFYDEYYDRLQSSMRSEEISINNDGYRYYVGHEHPITFQPAKIKRDIKQIPQGSEEEEAWEIYMDKYDRLDAVYSCKINDATSTLTFTHPLVQWKEIREDEENNTGKIVRYMPLQNTSAGRNDRLWEEFSRIEIVIKIRHQDYTKDDGLFRETIKITQYPGIYITVSHNHSDYNSDNSPNRRYVMVNGTTLRNNLRGDEFDYVNAIPSYSNPNCNPNMYLIHTTQLSEDIGDIYRIGDPRTNYYNNFLSSTTSYNTRDGRDDNLSDVANVTYKEAIRASLWGARYSWAWNVGTANSYSGTSGFNRITVAIDSAVNIDGTGLRSMRYYYPTDETSGSKADFIAPTFRIASSFGKIAINGRVEMRRRCAAYQESGRPAGRWRLPTKAEVKYIARLSAEGKIPILFGNDQGDKKSFGYYWCAQGLIRANADGDVEDEIYGDIGAGNSQYPPGLSAVRCVYDEWYWNEVDGGEFPQSPGLRNTNDALQTTFFWGDMIKR